MRPPQLLAAIFYVLTAVPASAGEAPILAVFDLEAKGIDLPPEIIGAMSEYVATRLTESGRFQVVPRSSLREALTREKVATYEECFDQSCQIELGKELAAEQTLAMQVGRIGKRCFITMKLFDLAKATASRAASAAGACTQDAIIASLDVAVAKLNDANHPATGAARTRREPEEVLSRGPARSIEGLLDVEFEVNKRVIRRDSFAKLDEVARVLLEDTSIRIRVEVHSDSMGSAVANKKLSQERADELRTYFIRKNVAPERVVAVGRGEEQPVAPNNTEEGRAANRRVEIVVLSPGSY